MDNNIRCLYMKDAPKKVDKKNFSEFGDHAREMWRQHKAVLERVGTIEKTALTNLVLKTLSVEKSNTFSPSTLLCALLALAGMCGGSSQSEILSAVACDKDNANSVYKNIIGSIDGNAGVSECSTSVSLWINQGAALIEDRIRHIFEQYGIEAFAGQMGSTAMDAAMQKWVNSHTGNMLTVHTSEMKTDILTVLELIAASYFKSDWDVPFRGKKTKKDTFHINGRETVQCNFMNGIERAMCLVEKQFMAVSKELQSDYQMWFVLPNEGIELETIASDWNVVDFLISPAAANLEQYEVSLSVPKFDVASKLDLKGIMQSMGIFSIFDEKTADFSPVSEEKLSLSKAEHAARVKIMEDGVEAASYVDFGIVAAGIPPKIKSLSIKLDRPFLFVISKKGKIPVYVGAVINPERE